MPPLALDGQGGPQPLGEGGPFAAAAAETEDPLVLLSLPPQSSLCRFLPLLQQNAGAAAQKSSKQPAAASGAASRSTSNKLQSPSLDINPAASAPLVKLSPSLLPDALRRLFQRDPQQLAIDRQQLATDQQQLATVVKTRDINRHLTYTAHVSKLSPLSVVLLVVFFFVLLHWEISPECAWARRFCFPH